MLWQVDKILGPGNQYVTAAKMLLQNSEAMVSMDMPAGPSEVSCADADSLPHVVRLKAAPRTQVRQSTSTGHQHWSHTFAGPGHCRRACSAGFHSGGPAVASGARPGQSGDLPAGKSVRLHAIHYVI